MDPIRSINRLPRICLDASLNVGGPGGTAGEGRLRGVSQAREAPVDGGVLAQAPVPLAVGVDVGADLAVRVEEGEAAEPEARVLAGADDAQAPDEALAADGPRVFALMRL